MKNNYDYIKKSTIVNNSSPYSSKPLTFSKSQLKHSKQLHDELFRNLINNTENFIDFIKFFINPDSQLSSDNLIKYNRSFVTANYKSRFSDVVFKEKDRQVYYLLEHQSSIDYSMPFRMLEYSYEILRDTIDMNEIKKKNYVGPKVVPILLYTGNKSWKIPSLINLLHAGKYEDFGINFKYIVIDTTSYSKETLLDSNSMVGFAMQADRSDSSKSVAEAIETMLVCKPNMRKEISNIVDYVFMDKLEEDDLKKLKDMIENEEVDVIMHTVRERLDEYYQGVWKKAEAQGIAQRNTLIAKNMIALGFSTDIISKITGLSKDEIDEIKNN